MSFVPGQIVSCQELITPSIVCGQVIADSIIQSSAIFKLSEVVAAGTANKTLTPPIGTIKPTSLILVATSAVTAIGAEVPFVKTITQDVGNVPGEVIIGYDATFAGTVTLVIIN